MTATSRSSSAAASPRSTATTTAGPTCTSPAAPNPAALYRNESPVGGALRFAQVPDPATDLTSVTGAYPIDIDGDGHDRPRRPAVRRERAAARPRRLPVRARQRGLGRSTAATPGRRRSAPRGRARRRCRRWRSATTSISRHGHDGTRRCADNELVRPADGAADVRRADAAHARLLHAVDAVQRLGPVRARATCGSRNDRHYYLDGEEQLWRIEPGEPPRLYTEAEGWQPMQIWGMGIASYDLTGDGYPEVYLTSQGDNKLQTLADGPAPAALPRHRARARRDRHPAVRRRRRAAVDGLARRVRRTSTTTASSTCSSPRATSRRCPTTPRRTRATCCSASADGTFVEGARGGRHRRLRPRPRRGRGRPQPRRAARPRRGQPPRERAAVAERRVGRRRRSRRRWATGSRSGSSRPAPNRDAIGSWIEVRTGDRTIEREVTVGGGHASGELGWIHFGLGRRRRAPRSAFTGPTARSGRGSTLAADRFATIERGATAPRSVDPAGLTGRRR